MRPELRRIKRGFSSMGCPERDLVDLLNLAKEFGFQHIELRCVGGCLDLPAEFGLHPGGRSVALRLIEESGVQVPLVASGLNLASPAFADSILAWAGLAEAMGSPWLRVFGDGGATGAPGEEQWKRIVSHLDLWRTLRLHKDLKVDLVVETHDLFATTRSCLELFSRAGQGIPLLWDVQHTAGTHCEPPEQTWGALGDWVRHVHVSDRSCQGSPFEIVLPGQGVLPVIETLDILEDARFEGAVCLEWERLWHPEIPPVEQALCAANRLWFGSLAGPAHHSDRTL